MIAALKWPVAIVTAIAVGFALGPRTPVDLTVHFDPSSIGPDPQAYLSAAEAKVPGIRPGQAKQIVWANASRSRTPVAIVYVHGFSASNAELRPLPDLVAKTLGANLFLTRLTGHGRDGAAMAEGSVNAWINDYAEAIAIGRSLGDKVFVVATSTGGSLATVEAANADVSKDVAGIVMISPNYGIQAAGSFLLTWPWSKQLAELIIGKERSFEPRNALQVQRWTTRYPTVALLPMAALVKLAAATNVETIKIPALFVLSDRDKVVRPELTKEIAARWGGPHELLLEDRAEDPDQHVISGDTISPATTGPLAARIAEWIRSMAG